MKEVNHKVNYKKVFDQAYDMMPNIFSSELFRTAVEKIDPSLESTHYFRFNYLLNKAQARITKRTWSKRTIIGQSNLNAVKTVKSINSIRPEDMIEKLKSLGYKIFKYVEQ